MKCEHIFTDIDFSEGLCPLCLKEENKQLQAKLDKHRWIPVSERLPEDNTAVSIVMQREGATWLWIGWYFLSNKKWEVVDAVRGNITYWKPIILPEKD